MATLPREITVSGTGGGQVLLLKPNSPTRSQALTLQGERVDVASAAGFLDKDGSLAATRHDFEWTCKTRDDLKFLEGFFDARQGRAGGFWFPHWFQEIELANYHDLVSLATWTVARGYASSIWPLGAAYRRFLFTYGAQFQSYRVSSVTEDDPSAGTDKLSLVDTGTTAAITLATPWTLAKGVQAFALRYGRFDTDVFSVTSHSNGGGIVRLAILELPDEAIE